MASLRRPAQAIPSKLVHSEPKRRAPLPGDAGAKRDARKSRVEEKMKSRRMSMRYGGPEFSLGPGAGDNGFLGFDPYQFTLDVAPPLLEVDEYGDENIVVPPPSAHKTSPAVFPKVLGGIDDDEDQHEATSEQEEAIRKRAPEEPQHDEWDFSVLKKKDVDMADYIRKTLAGADEAEKRRFIRALQKEKQVNSKELRKNVTKNYAEFVSISKEISNVENDMLELKELLTEWKGVPQLMDNTLAPTLDKDGNIERHRSRRNSPLDLEKMYKQQLAHLWTSIEGSQKYLQQSPGRHLVFETHNFVELNAATYKAKQSVSLFLLNDLLLIAGRRRAKAGSSSTSMDKDQERGRIVAERCWVLTDLVVIDIKDSGDLTNALKIKRGKEVCVYRSSKPEDKKALLSAFRQVSQDLAEKRRKENEAEQDRRRTMWQGDANARMTRMSMFMDANARPLSTIGTSLSDTKDLLWIDEFGDDLTMAIATRDWEEGVKLVERGNDLLRTVANNEEATEMLKFRLDSLKPNLVNQIAYDLSSLEIRKSSAARLITLLMRLNQGERARDTFLNTRHEVMLKLVRAIKHEGDIAIYINELAVVCFTVIRHTSDWYMNAFKDPQMASSFVTWAKEQIEYFGLVFRRQVYAPTIPQSVVDDCLKVTNSANRKLIRDVGLEFTFLLNSFIEPDPPESPTSKSSSSAASINRQTAQGFRMEMPSHFEPSLPGRQPLPSPGELSKGSTAPLTIRRPRGDDKQRAEQQNGSRNVSGAGNVGATNNSTTPSGASTPVKPPKSQRRSQLPPGRLPSRASEEN